MVSDGLASGGCQQESMVAGLSQKRTFLRLKEQVLADTYETQLIDTVLLQVTDVAARIAVPSTTALAWLERRLYGQISNAMKGILGKELDLQFVTSPLE
jgi:chromosomal replication initiation ATPase DnaA